MNRQLLFTARDLQVFFREAKHCLSRFSPMKNKFFVGSKKEISDFFPEGNFLLLHDHTPALPEWRRPVVFDHHRHHLNPLAHVDYHYAVYFTAVLDAVFSGKGDNTLTKDTGLDYILLALLDKPTSLHTLIPIPDKKSSSGHLWAYNKIQRILASPILRRVFDPDANQFKLNADRVVLAKLDRGDLEEFDALLLGLLLIGQYRGQIVIPELDFYGRDAHTRLIRQNRFIAGVNYLDELPPLLRRAFLSVKDITAQGATFKDAEELAKHALLRPDPLREDNPYNRAIEAAMNASYHFGDPDLQ